MFRRHPYLTVLSLLAAAVFLAGGIFLATFDLNSFRAGLQTRLSQALNRPVQLGTATLSWSYGPALDFANLEIAGQAEEPPLLQADHLYLKPKLLPLLIGRISFDEIVFTRPRVALTLSEDAVPRPQHLLRTLLDTVKVESLNVRHGALHLVDRRQPDVPFELDLRQITLKANHLYSRSRGRLSLEALLAQPRGGAAIKARGRLALPPRPEDWPQGWADLDLAVEGVAADGLLKRYGSRADIAGAEGRLTLQLKLAGSPADGLQFNGSLVGKELALHLPDYYQRPLALQQLVLQGRWTAGTDLHTIDQLTIQADGLALNGHFTLQRNTSEPWLEGGLATPGLAMAEIRRFLPDRLAAGMPAALGEIPSPEGTLRLDHARFAGPLSQFLRPGPTLPLQEAAVQLRNGRLPVGRKAYLQDISADLSFRKGRLSLSEGRALLLGSPLQFSGSLENPLAPAAKLAFGAGWVLPAGRLPDLFPELVNRGINGAGPIPLSLTLEGQAQRHELKLRADLSACTLNYPSFFNKPAGAAGELAINGTLAPDRLLLSPSHLELGPVKLTFSGERRQTEDNPFTLRIDLGESDLTAWRSLLPPLERYQVQGRLAGHYLLEGSGVTIRQAGGLLTVKDLGLRLAGILHGPLQSFNGRIRLFRDRLEWTGVTGRLGAFPVRVSGKLTDFSAPRTELQITAAKLRAGDLIFPSPKALLHQLSGRLVFTSSEVLFDSIRVGLDQHTAVTIDGRFQSGPNPTTTLEISAKQADIDKVTALWQGPDQDHADPENRPYTVIVKARVGRGSYGPLQFEKAQGTVTATPGLLRISPVRFSLGKGDGLAQITLRDRREGDKLLIISGHLDKVDADRLPYRNLLGQKGLLSGALDGDFYLQGLAGDRFVETSRGGLRIAVKDGVLYRFPFLSKVFSLLNVSQILTLKLPDMAREGMPFNELQGSFSLEKGKLTTEDLLVNSNAMNLSLVGDIDLAANELDLVLGVKPFQTVDKIITRIPVAGWLLTGEEKALITAHFEIKGPSGAPSVRPIPVTSVSDKVLGIFKRVLGLPGKVVTDFGELVTGEPEQAAEPAGQGRPAQF
jgi:uncharacterized protein involved in outer membrane biogenesis